LTESRIEPALREFLLSLGATEDQIEVAHATGHLAGLAADITLDRGFTMSPDDVAEHIGRPVEDVIEVCRLLGISVQQGVPGLGTDDERVLGELLPSAESLFDAGGGDELLRVIATSMARIADAAVAAYVVRVERDLVAIDASILDHARSNTAGALVAERLADSLPVVFRHHLRQAIDRQRRSQHQAATAALARVAVGFVDMVGFTALARELPTHELMGLVSRFEAKAFDLTVANGGRIVKHIGDEIMFTAIDPDDGCRIALDLVAQLEAPEPPHGGVAFGDVLTMHGDHYGPVVNLAARMADVAVPGEVLVDAATLDAVSAVKGEPAGRRLLKGFPEPIAVYSLTP
jgi:adenylate cyclase